MQGEKNERAENHNFEVKHKVADCILHLLNEVRSVLADTVIEILCDYGEALSIGTGIAGLLQDL